MRAIVTVKFDGIKPEFDESGKVQKVSGVCPIKYEFVETYCTDVYGKHHSYIERGNDLADIERKAKEKFGHVTRIEVIDEMILNDHGGW